MTSARQVLNSTFGYPEFRGPQEAIIDTVIAGHDALVLMPTGGGKSLCYQIPALVRPGAGLVVSPLIALMKDQVDALRQVGVQAGFLNSTQSAGEREAVHGALETGELDLLYIAPERLVQNRVLERLARYQWSVIAIDEAHCVSQWGHDFRKDYLALDQLRAQFPGVPRMALTATATKPTRADIVERLALDDPEWFISSFDRPNIRYQVQTKSDARRQLMSFLDARRDEPGIVYCLARKKTEETASYLQSQGVNALPYHAGLDAASRIDHQQRFLRGDNVVIVATIAFGMGIDKPDVRFVAHLDLPKSIESYYQETGRAGRDGAPADAWMVYGLQDVVRLRQMADQSDADEIFKRAESSKLDALLGWCELIGCRRRPLLGYFGESLEADCGNCDGCLTPATTWDGTVAAQKLLSTVYRTGQRFGAGHLIDVLLGKSTAKILQWRHHDLSVFGVGDDIELRQWRSVVRALVARGFLRADAERYGGLVLTEASRSLLKGETELLLREEPKPERRKRSKPSTTVDVAISDADLPLWDALRACRSRLADQHGVPPYVIFHDTTLRLMISERPGNEDELLALSGVGEAKLERYGEAFLDVLRNVAPALTD